MIRTTNGWEKDPLRSFLVISAALTCVVPHARRHRMQPALRNRDWSHGFVRPISVRDVMWRAAEGSAFEGV